MYYSNIVRHQLYQPVLLNVVVNQDWSCIVFQVKRRIFTWIFSSYMSSVTLTFFLSFQNHFSFGFSDKVTLNGHVPVGLYGNGFKSGSMRLGKDAIVFTKNGDVMSVGLLSQTFLEITKAEHVIVPIISFNKNNILFMVFF